MNLRERVYSHIATYLHFSDTEKLRYFKVDVKANVTRCLKISAKTQVRLSCLKS